jgi:ubiquinone/menaquinone biosynthesis C-methylase UbiE
MVAILGKMIKKVLYFNDYNRDKFVYEIAKAISVGSKVLDAGAGTGKYKSLFAHCDYKAQDFGSYEGVDHKYGYLDYVSDITAIPVEDSTFDWIICTEVLEHIPRPDLALREFARILRPGGALVLTAPLGSGIHMAPYHFYGGFTPYWYMHFLSKYGFELEACLPNGGFFKHYAQESQRLLFMLTPNTKISRCLFWPAKSLLAIWFRIIIPIFCHFLDRLDVKREFTVGYLVKARKL